MKVMEEVKGERMRLDERVKLKTKNGTTRGRKGMRGREQTGRGGLTICVLVVIS